MCTIKKIEKKFKKHGVSRLFDHLKPYAKNAISMELIEADDEEIEIGQSKMGGMPDLPAHVEWFNNPETNQPMTFVAQINFAEVKSFDTDNKLPKSGILYLFYDMEKFSWGFDPKDASGKKVYYFEGDSSQLERKNPPTDEVLFPTAGLAFESRVELPDWESNLIDIHLTDEEYDGYCNLREELDWEMNKILGHSVNIQGGMELECELVTNGFYCGDTSGYNDPRRKELEKNISNWNLLLQIDSNDEIDMMWGDVGCLYLWITEDNLKNKRFEDSWLILQCY